MKPIPVLGVLHYNRPDLLARCIASIDYAVETLVIIQNGPDSEGVEFRENGTYGTDRTYKVVPGTGAVPKQCKLGWYNRQLIQKAVIIKLPAAGVAGGWNEIIKLFPSPWWLIVSNDIQFAAGDLEKMARVIGADEWQASRPHATRQIAIACGNHGYAWFAITAVGVQAVGLFDENIYPAYLEDCDYAWRAKCADVRTEDVTGLGSIHGEGGHAGSMTIHSDPVLLARNAQTHAGNFEYYRAKWGGVNGSEVYRTPFNLPGVPVTHWTFDPVRRAAQQW